MKLLPAIILGIICIMPLACKPTGGGEDLTEAEIAELKAQRQRRTDSLKALADSAEAVRYKWKYDLSENAMGQKNHRAYVISKNEILLSSPYDDLQHGKLTVRNHTEYGKDVYFTVDEGQIVGDEIMMRFDDEDAFRVQYNEPTSGRSELIFLKGYNKLVRKLTNSDKLAIQVTFYGDGNHIFEFDISDLDMDKLK